LRAARAAASSRGLSLLSLRGDLRNGAASPAAALLREGLTHIRPRAGGCEAAYFDRLDQRWGAKAQSSASIGVRFCPRTSDSRALGAFFCNSKKLPSLWGT
jgi:hypothetical protein